MVATKNNRILLVILVLLCFFTIHMQQVQGNFCLKKSIERWIENINIFLFQFHELFLLFFAYAARVLKERSNLSSEDASTAQHREVHGDLFKPKDEDVNVKGEVFSMDYSPASRKPPIHN